MKNPLHDSLFCGIIALQLATFGFLFGPKWGDSVPLASISNAWNRASIEAGHPLPLFSAYDRNGVRQSVLSDQGQESAVVFKGTCSCDEGQVSNWLDAARKKGKPVTLIIPLDEKDEAQSIARNHWKARILRVRRVELERLGLLKQGAPQQLPLVAYLDASGAILGVQSS